MAAEEDVKQRQIIENRARNISRNVRCTECEGNKSCTLGLCGAAASLFCCSTQWVCAAPRGQHLGLFFSLLGQLQLVGQQQLASTFLGQQEHLRLDS